MRLDLSTGRATLVDHASDLAALDGSAAVFALLDLVPGSNDIHAVGVAMAGETAHLRGASVIALINLAPTNPRILYVVAVGCVRRRLPRGFRLKGEAARGN